MPFMWRNTTKFLLQTRTSFMVKKYWSYVMFYSLILILLITSVLFHDKTLWYIDLQIPAFSAIYANILRTMKFIKNLEYKQDKLKWFTFGQRPIWACDIKENNKLLFWAISLQFHIIQFESKLLRHRDSSMILHGHYRNDKVNWNWIYTQ